MRSVAQFLVLLLALAGMAPEPEVCTGVDHDPHIVTPFHSHDREAGDGHEEALHNHDNSEDYFCGVLPFQTSHCDEDPCVDLSLTGGKEVLVTDRFLVPLHRAAPLPALGPPPVQLGPRATRETLRRGAAVKATGPSLLSLVRLLI